MLNEKNDFYIFLKNIVVENTSTLLVKICLLVHYLTKIN